ncbi:hypothetical protein KL86APRO_30178 [uncultured Alphaproteobacteria bacterium]|uniref:Uncharacterized protein n=1 Tax=uncultured Alphaproteobacteria bacterium TaxID=91750 RepID=A0A212KLZ4_9PROT|nr:hypothetical protein KL86APRO_30178 [uncultured Alphaproteobacteria bacterium]
MIRFPRALFAPEEGGGAAAAATPTAAADVATGETAAQASEAEAGSADADASENAQGEDADAGKDAGGEETGEAEGDDAPTEYAFTLPEGFDGFDDEAMAAATPLLREGKVSQDTAQKLVDVVAGLVQRQVATAQQALAEQREQRSAAWLKELQDSKDFGGAAFDANSAAVRGVIEKFADTDPEFVFPEGHPNAGKPVPGGAVKKLLKDAGLGNAGPLITMLHRLAKATGEDSMPPGDGGGAPTAMSEADFMAEVFAKSRKS